MRRSPSNLASRACGVVLVGLLHAALVWFLTRTPIGEAPAAIGAEPVTITLSEPSSHLDVDARPSVVEVSLVNVARVELPVPEVQDIPVEEPALSIAPAAAPSPASVSVASEESGTRAAGGQGRLLLTRVGAAYPPDAMRRREEGTTQVAMRVDETGHVVEVKVTESSGSPRLDAAAVSAFRKWRFVSVPKGSDPNGSWIQTYQRFLLSQVKYSILQAGVAEDIRVAETGTRESSPSGSDQTLRRFLKGVAEGRLDDVSPRGRAQLAEMRAALSRWGVVKSVEFISTAGPAEWTTYPVSDDARSQVGVSRVDCKWAVLEVRHQNAKTVWLIGFDRNGTVWSARTGPAS